MAGEVQCGNWQERVSGPGSNFSLAASRKNLEKKKLQDGCHMVFILLQSHDNVEILEEVDYNIYQNQNIISDQFGALHFILELSAWY